MKLPFYQRLFYLVILTSSNFLLNDGLRTKKSIAEDHNAPKMTSCPQELVSFGNLLPSHITESGNRVIQNSGKYSRKLDFFPAYIITASKPEFEPLSFNQFQSEKQTIPDGVKQIFFTSLERQYSNNKTLIQTQNYHWLIMNQTSEGWNLVMAFTRFGYPQGDKFVVSPARNTTNGVIGQAVKIWLKDCNFGTLREYTIKN